jgi:hypothetical protein
MGVQNAVAQGLPPHRGQGRLLAAGGFIRPQAQARLARELGRTAGQALVTLGDTEQRRRRFSCTASSLMELDACRSAVADFPK